jgi:hypothetical protein
MAEKCPLVKRDFSKLFRHALIAALAAGLICVFAGEVAGRSFRAYGVQSGLREFGGLLLLAAAGGSLIASRKSAVDRAEPLPLHIDLRGERDLDTALRDLAARRATDTPIWLDLRAQPIHLRHIEQLAAIRDLAHLDLRDCHLSADLFEQMDRFWRVSEIRLSGGHIDPWELRQLQVALPACAVYDDAGNRADFLPVAYRRPGSTASRLRATSLDAQWC